jgi:EAL and modified HD-GYP domain-containing signal transduction protein
VLQAYSIIDLGRRAPRDAPPAPGVSRKITAYPGRRAANAQMEAMPSSAAPSRCWAGRSTTPSSRQAPARPRQPDLSAIVELINRIDRQEEPRPARSVLKNDPTLAFKLMRYINSPAFGLRVEVTSRSAMR